MRFNELVFAYFLAHLFEGNICQHFIRIHIGRSTRSTLEHVCEKLVMIFSIDHILTGFFNGGEFFLAY